jgi:L-2-hydroxyglutarate oxidase LhgO
MFDLVVVGGGLVGLATAFRYLRRFSGRGVALLEKEPRPAGHQSGHNSGVLHSGVFYTPGSLKADLCRRGKAQMEALCREFELPFERCGKLIVATRERELLGLAGGETLRARRVIVCAGLQSDRLARLSGLEPPLRIVPFLGEYHALKPAYRSRVRALVYPVPDPRLPFLGVHFTRRCDGRVDCGPNAIPTWAREGYSKFALEPRDALEILGWPGFWRLVDDFLIEERGAVLNVLNAPSPAATSSLAIADQLLERLAP